MADVVTPEIRSRMMAGIKGKNTKPEVTLRRGLHKLGFRFALHKASLPGKPDLVFPRYRAVLFAHGCFWHGHNCRLFKLPATRTVFWKEKILRNREVDQLQFNKLTSDGWRVGIVWECALKTTNLNDIELVIQRCANWLQSSRRTIVIRGKYKKQKVK